MDPVITVTLNPALDKTVTLDAFQVGGLNRVRDIRMDAGGKGINVAKVLQKFGVEARSLCIAGGTQGQVLRQKLDELGIPSVFWESEGETRINMKVVDVSTKETTELNEPGIHMNESARAGMIDMFKKEIAQASLVVLGGSLPPGAPRDVYRTLIDLAKQSGKRTLLDAEGEALALGIEAAPYVIKPNIHELEQLMGQTFTSVESIIQAARSITARGVEYVLVSMGGEGSLLIHGEQAIHARPFPITPMSTVGAGDSMVAAMTYCILHDQSLEDVARWTSAAGTVTASKPGTQVCTKQEVEQSLSLVQITRIS